MGIEELKLPDDYDVPTEKQKSLYLRLVSIAEENDKICQFNAPNTRQEYAILINRLQTILYANGLLPEDLIKHFLMNRRFSLSQKDAEEKMVPDMNHKLEMYNTHKLEKYGIINPSPWTIEMREKELANKDG